MVKFVLVERLPRAHSASLRVSSVEGAGMCESLGLPRVTIFAVFFIKEELLCVVCEAVVEHLVLHSENILHFN